MIRIDSIRKQIRKIKTTQRSRHDIIIKVLNDIVDFVEDRCGKDVPKLEAIKILGEEDDRTKTTETLGTEISKDL